MEQGSIPWQQFYIKHALYLEQNDTQAYSYVLTAIVVTIICVAGGVNLVAQTLVITPFEAHLVPFCGQ